MAIQESALRPEMIPVGKLRFDPENPRLPSYMHNKGNEREVLEWMLSKGDIVELMQSIGEQDYFAGEPLLAVRSETETDTYIVVEGNRRLAALKLLQDPKLRQGHPLQGAVTSAVAMAKYRPESVPVMVYGSRLDILRYLGYRHVSGIRPWSPIAKARYLEVLLKTDEYNELPEQQKYRQLARAIGSTPSYVKKLLTSLILANVIAEKDYFGIAGLDEESLNFSLLYTALGYPSIAKFVGLDGSSDLVQKDRNELHLYDLTRWLFEIVPGTGRTKLEDSRHLGLLAEIVTTEDARLALDKYSIHEAVLYTNEPIKAYRRLIEEVHGRLKAAQDRLAQIKVLELRDEDDLRMVSRLVRDLTLAVRDRLDDDASM